MFAFVDWDFIEMRIGWKMMYIPTCAHHAQACTRDASETPTIRAIS